MYVETHILFVTRTTSSCGKNTTWTEIYFAFLVLLTPPISDSCFCSRANCRFDCKLPFADESRDGTIY